MIAETRGDYRLGDGATPIEDASTGLMLTTLAPTDAGLTAIGHAVPTETTAPDADTAPHAATDAAVAPEADAVAVAPPAGTPARATLRKAAQEVLAAWDDKANRDADIIAVLECPTDIRRAFLAERTSQASTGAPRTPRNDTKQEIVLAMMRRDEGPAGRRSPNRRSPPSRRPPLEGNTARPSRLKGGGRLVYCALCQARSQYYVGIGGGGAICMG